MLPQLPMARELTVALPAAGSRRALVLDTNIVLDLLVFADPATALLPGLMASGALHWIATVGMRSELSRVLSYPQIAPRVAFYGLTPEGVLAWNPRRVPARSARTPTTNPSSTWLQRTARSCCPKTRRCCVCASV